MKLTCAVRGLCQLNMCVPGRVNECDMPCLHPFPSFLFELAQVKHEKNVEQREKLCVALPPTPLAHAPLGRGVVLEGPHEWVSSLAVCHVLFALECRTHARRQRCKKTRKFPCPFVLHGRGRQNFIGCGGKLVPRCARAHQFGSLACNVGRHWPL